jgi:hypothetical protein
VWELEWDGGKWLGCEWEYWVGKVGRKALGGREMKGVIGEGCE